MKVVANYNSKKVYLYTAGNLRISSDDFKLLKPYFVCTFFFHDTNWNEDNLAKILNRLIKCGCVYFIFHGNRCEDAHDLADAVIGKLQSSQETDRDVIMTSWHEKELIEDVIFYTFSTALPAEDSFDSYLIFSFGSSEENTHVRDLLNDIDGVIRH